jgi:hypothetical protein
MRINEIGANYETTGKQKQLADIGRKLMDLAVSTKDDQLSVAMSRLGNELTAYGTPFGAQNMAELEKKTALPQALILKLMKFGQQHSYQPKGEKVVDEPDQDEF